jgi:hypothetical protein
LLAKNDNAVCLKDRGAAFASKPAPTMMCIASTWCANQKQRTNFNQKTHSIDTNLTSPSAISYTSCRLASPLL